MSQSTIQPPAVIAGARFSILYHAYLIVAAWILRKLVASMTGDGTAFDKKIDIATPGVGGGKVPASVCIPAKISGAESSRFPCLLVLEGGGFILGEPNDGQQLARYISDQLGIVVISLDYAKSPAYPHPHALLQAYEAIRWMRTAEARNVLGVGIDMFRIATLGKSAGGSLAAALSLLLAMDNGPCAAFKDRLGPDFRHAASVLLYPSVASNQPYRDRHAMADKVARKQSLPVFVAELMETCYLPPRVTKDTVFVAPLLADAPLLMSIRANVPPSLFFLCGMDCLKIEAGRYAAKLHEAGVEVDVKEYPEAIHGFIQYPPGAKEHRPEDIVDCKERMVEFLGRCFAEKTV